MSPICSEYLHAARNSYRAASAGKKKLVLGQQCSKSFLDALKYKLTQVFKISFLVDFSIKDLRYLVT